MDFKVTNTQLVEIFANGVASTGSDETNFPFPNLPFLNGTFCRSLEFYTVNDMALSPTNRALIDTATLQKAYLTLYIIDPKANGGQGGEYIRQLPLVSMHSLNNGVDPFEQNPFLMSGQIISWDKCTINLPTRIGNVANWSFLFNVGFDFNPGYKAN